MAAQFPAISLTIPLQGIGLSLIAPIRFAQNQNGAHDNGDLINLLVDTGSDITWVAAPGFGPLMAHNVAVPTQPILPANAPQAARAGGPGIVVDGKVWTARYGTYGASGTTLTNMPIGFGPGAIRNLAIGYANQVSIQCRTPGRVEGGFLGLNLNSTIHNNGWPGTRSAYVPIWRQLLQGTNLPRRFSIAIPVMGVGIQANYNGTLEIGCPFGPLPANAITVPVQPRPGPTNEWLVSVQFYARVPNPPGANTPFTDVAIGGSHLACPDTGCQEILVPAAIANVYNGMLNGSPVPANFPPQPNGRHQVAMNGAQPLHDYELVVGFTDSKRLLSEKKVVVGTDKLISPAGWSSVLGGAGNGVPTLLGMQFFLSVARTIFDSGLAVDGKELGGANFIVVPQ